MNTADRIGFLSGFGWIAGHNFWVTLLLCWLLTPGLFYLIGLVLESRPVPLSWNYQFTSFFPGDLFLGGMVAGLLVLAKKLPAEDHFYNATWFHVLVLVVTVAVAVVITALEYNDPNGYGHRAVMSPTKLYHNILLYGGYGYIIVTTLIAVVMSAETRGLLLVGCLVPGWVWVTCLIADEKFSDKVKRQRVRHAHVKDWSPIWSLP